MLNCSAFFSKTCFRSLLFFLFFISNAYAQNQRDVFKNISLGVQSYYGSFLTTQPKSVYIRDSYASFTEIYLQKQTCGNSDWEVTHRYPQWGIAFLFGNTGSRTYIGNMYSLFAYINTPLIKTQRYTASFRLGAGPGIAEKPYNIYTNPKNTLIGTRLNAFINMALLNEIKISSRLYLNAGLAFTHLSNGGTTLPNLGLNTPAITGGIRYALTPQQIAGKRSLDSFCSTTRYHVSISAGEKQIGLVGGPHNTIIVLQPEVSKRFRCNHAYGAGAAIYINPVAGKDNKEMRTNGQPVRVLQAGLYGSYEHFFGRISIPVQLGAYVFNKGDNTFIFQQMGLRCRINNHINTELLLKAHLGKAELIHAGIGYTM